MKKFSMNLMKVTFLLIMVMCMLGVISQVHAVERVKADLIIEEETIELSKGETKSFTYAFDVVKVDGEICMRLNEDYTLPGAHLTHESTTEIKSENTQIATVDEFGKITAVDNGKTKIICEVSTEWEGKDMIFYDEVMVFVGDLNDREDDSDGELEVDFGEFNEVMNIVKMIVDALLDIVKKIDWQGAASMAGQLLTGFATVISGLSK